MSSLLRSIFSIFSGKIAAVVIGAVFTPVLVRLLTQSQYGLYASITAAYAIIFLVAKGGLFDATRKIVAEKSDVKKIKSAICGSISLSILYGIVFAAILVASARFEILGPDYNLYIYIAAIVAIFGNILNSVNGAFYGLKRESVGEVLRISRQGLSAVLSLSLAYFGFGLTGVFAGYTASFLIVSTVGITMLRREVGELVKKARGATRYLDELSVYGGYQLIGGLSATLLYKTDILLVDYFGEATATALYQSAIVPAEMIWFVPSAIQLAFLQHTADLWSNGEVSKINRNIKQGVKYAILSLTLFGVGLFTLTEPFLAVYFGESYAAGSDSLRILIFGTFFFGVTRVIAPVLQATGRIKQTETVTVVALIINICINIILIPSYGIIGAAVGTTVSYSAHFLGNLLLWSKSSFDIPSIRWTLRLVSFQSLFSIIFISSYSYIELSGIISLIIFPPYGLFIFIVVNIFGGYIDLSDIATI